MGRKRERRQFDEVRDFYAKCLAAYSRSDDPRIERAFDLVPREAFLPPGPWKIFTGGVDHTAYVETPSADPIHLYHDVLVALDEDKALNTGQPSLHAAWLGAIAPAPGETVLHIGAGRGYYTAILSILVLPDGHVTAVEINPDLAAAAQDHLMPFDNVTLVAADGTAPAPTEADVIYVNAGVTAPPAAWLEALRPGGRLIFPWRPAEDVGLAMLVTRTSKGFAARTCGPAYFIPCIGASEGATLGPVPDLAAARRARSARLTADRQPDTTAIAIYRDVWFSEAAASEG